MTVGNDEVEADSGVKQEGEGEMEPSADEEVKTSGRVGGTDQPMEYIIHFARQSNCTNRKTVFQVRESQTPHMGLPKRH